MTNEERIEIARREVERAELRAKESVYHAQNELAKIKNRAEQMYTDIPTQHALYDLEWSYQNATKFIERYHEAVAAQEAASKMRELFDFMTGATN